MPGQQAILDFNMKVRSYENDDDQVCSFSMTIFCQLFRFLKWPKKYVAIYFLHLSSNFVLLFHSLPQKPTLELFLLSFSSQKLPFLSAWNSIYVFVLILQWLLFRYNDVRRFGTFKMARQNAIRLCNHITYRCTKCNNATDARRSWHFGLFENWFR